MRTSVLGLYKKYVMQSLFAQSPCPWRVLSVLLSTHVQRVSVSYCRIFFILLTNHTTNQINCQPHNKQTTYPHYQITNIPPKEQEKVVLHLMSLVCLNFLFLYLISFSCQRSWLVKGGKGKTRLPDIF